VQAHAAPGARVAVLGPSYKPDTQVVEKSQGIALAAQLGEAGYVVSVYDPIAMSAGEAILGDRVTSRMIWPTRCRPPTWPWSQRLGRSSRRRSCGSQPVHAEARYHRSPARSQRGRFTHQCVAGSYGLWHTARSANGHRRAPSATTQVKFGLRHSPDRDVTPPLPAAVLT
jgi:hypothetical protein